MAKSGSIPACTGEASPPRLGLSALKVYPRMHGGSQPGRPLAGNASGLSPHARGKPAWEGFSLHKSGSIPACTGEAKAEQQQDTDDEVYPRMHGGSQPGRPLAGNASGLSPHARGKPVGRCRTDRATRSIPACTGEASAGQDDDASDGVYPRMHGGSGQVAPADHVAGGLSPHARGKPRWATVKIGRSRSIPACTGEALRLALSCA